MAEAPPFVAALTGSIGMGKSETARLFAGLGIPVHDSDAEVHALYDVGGAAVGPIAQVFPVAVRDGKVDRALLVREIAGKEEAFQRLEAIVHPLVAAERRRFLAEQARRGAALVILDIPLLFETGGEKEVDAIIVCSAPPEVQRARVLARPGMTPEKLEAIHARQMTDAEKRAKADFIIETGASLDDALAQVKTVAASLLHKAAQRRSQQP